MNFCPKTKTNMSSNGPKRFVNAEMGESGRKSLKHSNNFILQLQFTLLYLLLIINNCCSEREL